MNPLQPVQLAELSPAEIQRLVCVVLEELHELDWKLLRYDVSERAITHKLAEYLKRHLPEYDVDCEYNRNYGFGELAQKKITGARLEAIRRLDKRQLREAVFNGTESLSTYPDVIVHQRLSNEWNLLIIEVKKENSQVDHNFDRQKLIAFTQQDGPNRYNYRYGLFIRLVTGTEELGRPILEWYVNGANVVFPDDADL